MPAALPCALVPAALCPRCASLRASANAGCIAFRVRAHLFCPPPPPSPFPHTHHPSLTCPPPCPTPPRAHPLRARNSASPRELAVSHRCALGGGGACAAAVRGARASRNFVRARNFASPHLLRLRAGARCRAGPIRPWRVGGPGWPSPNFALYYIILYYIILYYIIVAMRQVGWVGELVAAFYAA